MINTTTSAVLTGVSALAGVVSMSVMAVVMRLVVEVTVVRVTALVEVVSDTVGIGVVVLEHLLVVLIKCAMLHVWLWSVAV